MNNIYYNGNQILTKKDLNGNTPEIYIICGNRSSGKTTFYNKLIINRFIKNNQKFAYLLRYKDELDTSVCDKIFKEVRVLFFPDYYMSAKSKVNGLFYELYLNDVSCGYALAINTADKIKKYSNLLSDTSLMLFDEFLPESNQYAPNEVKKFISLHTSIARGGGAQSRYLPVYMVANNVNVLNPYFVELGIADRLQPNTKYLRGTGWVLEMDYNENASKAQSSSTFMQAFSSNEYTNYSIGHKSLYSDDNFVEKLNGINRYVCTIKYKGTEYSIREYPEMGVIYCSDNIDSSFKLRIAVDTSDHNINYIMLNRYDGLIKLFRLYFEQGLFRFKTSKCKQAIINLLKY